MTIETGSYISDFNVAWPQNVDPEYEGAGHLRWVKQAIKATFPNLTGVVNPTQAEMNNLVGSGANTLASTYTLANTANTTANTANTTANAALPKAGGTMTGLLVLSADPSAALNPVSLQYLQANYAKLSGSNVAFTNVANNFTSAQTLASAVVGSPTGGNQGAGTINATGLFVNGTAVSTGGSTAPVKHVTVLTSGTTWTTNAAHKWATITVIGGGGGGQQGSAGTSGGGGGASGGVAQKTYTNLTANTGYTYAIGAGGGSQTAGGNTSFTGPTVITGNGGSANGFTGGTATNGDINIAGQAGQSSAAATNSNGTMTTFGGNTPLGFGLGAPSTGGVPGTATGYGAGGGGSSFISGAAGSAGTTGAIIIEEWY